jgi:hypothetical protein
MFPSGLVVLFLRENRIHDYTVCILSDTIHSNEDVARFCKKTTTRAIILYHVSCIVAVANQPLPFHKMKCITFCISLQHNNWHGDLPGLLMLLLSEKNTVGK